MRAEARRPAGARPPAAGPPRSAFRRHAFLYARPLVMLSDAALCFAAFALLYALRFRWGLWTPAPAPGWGPYARGAALAALCAVAAMAWLGVYRDKRGASKFDDVVLTGAGLGLGAIAALALSFFVRDFSYSRLVTGGGYLLAFALLAVWHLALRLLQTRALAHGWGTLETVILGHNGLGEALSARLSANPRLGYRVIGHVALPGEPEEGPGVLGTPEALEAIVEATGAEMALVAWPGGAPEQVFALVRRLQALDRPISVRIVPGILEVATTHLELGALDGLPVLAIREVPLRRRRHRFAKRAMDALLAGAALVALAPLFAALAVLVKRSGPGPVFYAQERVGRDGHAFTIYKFRSMRQDAEPDGPVWATPGDARVTPLGGFLRRYSLDELPQLWNVFKGDMSLVGPRPERPYFVDRFSRAVPKYEDRHLVRCGLTGWAQINGLRGDVSIEERTRHDLYYVENWSLLLDLRILFATAFEIFRRPAD